MSVIYRPRQDTVSLEPCLLYKYKKKKFNLGRIAIVPHGFKTAFTLKMHLIWSAYRKRWVIFNNSIKIIFNRTEKDRAPTLTIPHGPPGN